MSEPRRITDGEGRVWTVTAPLTRADHGNRRVRASRAGIYFQSGSECRVALVAVADPSQRDDSELLALLWGAEPCESEDRLNVAGNAWNRLYVLRKTLVAHSDVART